MGLEPGRVIEIFLLNMLTFYAIYDRMALWLISNTKSIKSRKIRIMKKLLSLLLILTIIVLCACNRTPANRYTVTDFYDESINKDAYKEVNYFSSNASYYPFKSAEELTIAADIVIIGRVTDISFEVLDIETGFPPTEETNKQYCRQNTLYNVDVITTYKGDISEKIKIGILGGIKDYRVEEQLALVKKMNAFPPDGILTDEGVPEIKIDGLYLFTLCKSKKTGRIINMIPQQSIYNLNNPFEKQGISGSGIMSARDVISVFGEDKWSAFWSEWQKDNPDWETRIRTNIIG